MSEKEQQLAQCREMLRRYQGVPGALLPALHEVQNTFGCVDHTMHLEIAEALGLSVTDVASVQSYYRFFSSERRGKYVIRLCSSAPCHLGGADALLEAFEEALGISAGETTADGKFTLLTTGCIGACDKAPAALINDTVFGPIDPAKVGQLLTDLESMMEPEKQVSLADYVAKGGYEGLRKAVHAPEQIIPTLTVSGLRGRSGSGFPVGTKWKTTLNAPADQKYVICNADEGEPETAKDHQILRENPYAVLEGMCIAALSVGATEGILYLRQEYAALAPVLERCIQEAEQAGYLGDNVCGSGQAFHVELRLGAGAYLCGEETALLESIEGNRGVTRLKPPYPGEKGLWQKPTIINNVETLATVPEILRFGGEAYRKNGTEKCPGVKKMTLSGQINRPGVYDIPMGTTVREIYEDYAGGSKDGKPLLAIQTGGQSGTLVTPDFLEVPFDIENSAKAGGFFGTGDLMFITEGTDLLELLTNITEFFVDESCGTCTPCRIGLVHMVTLLKKLTSGQGQPQDITRLKELAVQIKDTSRCAFGTAAVTPVLSALANFAPLFEQAVRQGGAY
jgi:NADH-quinone oxidoreductase subunit F